MGGAGCRAAWEPAGTWSLTDMERVAIYCRLSEEDRHKRLVTDDSASIQNQKNMLVQYAVEQHWEIYRIYSDDDYTGADRSRPAFNCLLEDARKRRFSIVLCKTQSRFTRELELVEKYIHGLFPAWGIRFVSIVDNADTANRGNKKSRQINGLVNEWYLEDMSENIRSVLTNRRENGYHIGSFALYGYKKDPEHKGHLLIDEEAAQTVREIFALFAQGYGKTAIARMLNNRGIPNPTEYKRQHGLRYRQPASKNSTLWKYCTIAGMLVNEIYIGNMVQGKYGSVSYKTKTKRPRPAGTWYIVKGTHEPIIDRVLWDRVQDMIRERSKPFRKGTLGLFAGKARCACCGYTLRSSKTRERYYLKCPNRYMADHACPGAFIAVDRLERMVLAELKRLLSQFLDRPAVAARISVHPDWEARKAQLQSEMEADQKRIAACTKAMQDLYLDRVQKRIEQEDFAALSVSLSGERKRLEKHLADIRSRIGNIQGQLRASELPQETVKRYLDMQHLTRGAVEILIDHIAVGRRIPGTREVPVEIHWNF